MKFHTLKNGQKIAWHRNGAKTDGLGACYVLPLGAAERTTFEGEEGPDSVAWYNDIRDREDVEGFDFPAEQSDADVITTAETGNYV